MMMMIVLFKRLFDVINIIAVIKLLSY